jgi:hypothetical protein
MYMKKTTKAVIALAVWLGCGALAQAGIPSDSLVITIAPNAYYAVSIDTDNVGLDLGAVELGGSTQTVNASTVTIDSTYASTELELTGAITCAGGQEWTFDADTSNQEGDYLAGWAVFADTETVTSAPAFNGNVPGAANSDVISAGTLDVGDDDGAEVNLFEDASKQMNNLAKSAKAHAWFKFRLPDSSTSGSDKPQSITITLTAKVPD